MRLRLVIMFSAICGSAMAADAGSEVTLSATPPVQVQSPEAMLALSSPEFVRPKPISSHQCDLYFPTAKKKLVQHPTVLSFKITVDGSVQNVRVSRSSGSELFDQEGARCATKWRYEAATENGNPVEMNWSAAIDWHRH
jgi:TonB family protein